ncbi:hypothetical protein RI367_001672 [Sorochytrium milnesiophthora]
MPDNNTPKRVAVIGSGLAGLTTAYLLSHPQNAGRFQVVLLEQSQTYGMDAACLDIPCGCTTCTSGNSKSAAADQQQLGAAVHVKQSIDNPLRAFNEGYYPTMVQLYRHVGVRFAPGDYSLCFARMDAQTGRPIEPPVLTDTVLSLGPVQFRLPTFLVQPWKQLGTPRIIYDRFRFGRAARHLRATGQLASLKGTLKEYLHRHAYSHVYVHDILLPFMSTFTTAPHDTVMNMPARTILDWASRPTLKNAVLTVPDGIHTVCQKLTQYLAPEDLRFNTPVQAVHALQDTSGGKDGGPSFLVQSERGAELFDVVVFATPACVTANILSHDSTQLSSLITDDGRKQVVSLPSDLHDALTAISYRRVRVTVHTDTSLLPADAQHHRGITLTSRITPPSNGSSLVCTDENGDDTMTTVSVNLLRSLPTHCPPMLQTTNPLVDIPDKHVIASWMFPRTYVTERSYSAVDALYKMQRRPAVPSSDKQLSVSMYFVGSAVFPGIPLLEGCVASAIDVANRLGVERPWTHRTHGEYLGFDPEHAHQGIVDRYFSGQVSHSENNTTSKLSSWMWACLALGVAIDIAVRFLLLKE